MSASNGLAAFLSQNPPQVETNQALLIVGLQHDFICPDGKLPVDTSSGFVDRILELVPKFRERAGDIIWVRSEYDERQTMAETIEDGNSVIVDMEEAVTEPEVLEPVIEVSKKPKPKSKPSKQRRKAMNLLKRVSPRKSDTPAEPELVAEDSSIPCEDDELFFSKLNREPCCIRESKGAAFPNNVEAAIDSSTDIMVKTSHYSAFKSTHLLVTLRMKRITELFICGCMTNVAVYATAQHAASGFSITIIDDCLGYRKKARHDMAIQHITEGMGAQTISSREILDDLNAPPEAEDDELQGNFAKMAINDDERLERKGNDTLKSFVENMEKSLAQISLSSDNARPASSSGKPTATKETTLELVSGAESVRAGAKAGLRARASMPDFGKGHFKAKVRMRRTDSTKADEETRAEEPPDQVSKTGLLNDMQTRAPVMEKIAEMEPATKDQASVLKDIEPSSASVQSDHRNAKSKTASASKRNQDSPSEEYPEPSAISPSDEKQLLTRSGQAAPTTKMTCPASSQLPPGSSSRSQAPPTNLPAAGAISKKKLPSLANLPVLGPEDSIGEGDSCIKYNLLPPAERDSINEKALLSSTIFRGLYNEVDWQKMYHAAGEVPRLVAVQGLSGSDGSKPVYRHPSDQSPPLLPFSAKVKLVKEAAEKVVGHPLNHVLIQLYRDGKDYISEHSDKTLDIVRGSKIVNASFGAQRTMRLRKKKTKASPDDQGDGDTKKASSSSATEPREVQRIAMPHNSIFVLGLKTNQSWLHSINADKRLPAEKSPEELAYDGMRISLTFRHIGTFLSSDEKKIWGQGAKSESIDDAGDTVNGNEKETKRLIQAFGRENHEDEGWTWEESYAGGFDVLHFRGE
jgi:nicotinamidase-related amidase/alkylated DNA repair dioxygenase AlkB